MKVLLFRFVLLLLLFPLLLVDAQRNKKSYGPIYYDKIKKEDIPERGLIVFNDLYQDGRMFIGGVEDFEYYIRHRFLKSNNPKKLDNFIYHYELTIDSLGNCLNIKEITNRRKISAQNIENSKVLLNLLSEIPRWQAPVYYDLDLNDFVIMPTYTFNIKIELKKIIFR